jgi:hypothetical protein
LGRKERFPMKTEKKSKSTFLPLPYTIAVGVMLIVILLVIPILETRGNNIGEAKANLELSSQTFEVANTTYPGQRIVLVVGRAEGSKDPYWDIYTGSVYGTIYVEQPEGGVFQSGSISGDSVTVTWVGGPSQLMDNLYIELPGWNYIFVYPTAVDALDHLP